MAVRVRFRMVARFRAAAVRLKSVLGFGREGMPARFARRPRRRNGRSAELVAACVQTLETRTLLTATAILPEAPSALESQAAVVTQISGSFTIGSSSFAARINSVGSNGIDPARNTWVLIHGWNSDSNVWAASVGASLAAAFPDDTVLTFDWSSAANTGIFNPGLAESRIQPAAAWLAQQLEANGFSASQVNFIGHSFGAYVANEAAERMAGPARSIFALDPAMDIGGGFNPENVAEVNFRNEAAFSYAFIDGASSNLGSSLAASTAAQSFVVKNADHSLYRMFQQLFASPTRATQWFDLAHLESPAPWVVDQFDEFGSPTSTGRRLHEGVITLNTDKITIQSSAYFPLGDAARLASRTPLTFLPPAKPVVAALGANLTWTEGTVPVLIASAATVRDADSTNFNGGSLVVQITANGHADDRLLVRNQGTATGQIGVDGSNITFGGVVIGTFTPGDGLTPLVINFNDRATAAAAEALLRNITFSNVSLNPTTAARTLRVTASDGDAGASAAVTKTVSVTAVNNPPVIGAFDVPVVFTEAAGPVLLDEDATVTDPDSPNFSTGRLTVRLSANGNASDRIAVRNQGTSAGLVGVSGTNVSVGGVVVGTVSGGTGTTALTVTFNTAATGDAVQAVLRNVFFENSSTAPTTALRTVQVTLTDGDGGTTPVLSKTITVVPVNTRATVAAFDTLVVYSKNSAAVILDADATVTDPDSANFAGGSLTVTLTANADDDDRLAIRNQGRAAGQIGVTGSDVTFGTVVIGSFTGGDGANPLVITLNDRATPAAVQALLRNITFASPTLAPSTLPRTVSVQVDDGDGATSNVASKTIQVGRAPVVAAFDTAVAYTENAAPAILDTNATVTDADSTNFNTGTLAVSFTQNGEANDRLSIRHQGTAAGQVGFSGGNVTFGTTLIGTATGGDGTNPLLITFNAQATAAAVQAVLRSITFANVSDAPSTAQRRVQVVLTDDDGLASAASSKVITVTAVNDVPTITGFDSSVPYSAAGAPVLVDDNAAVTDPDSADFDTGRLTVQLVTNAQTTDRLTIRSTGTNPGEISVTGTTVFYGGMAIGTFSGGTGSTAFVVTFNRSATRAAVEAVLRSIQFSSTVGTPSATARTVRVTLTDGDGGTSTAANKSVTITA